MTMSVFEFRARTREGASALVQAVERSPELLSSHAQVAPLGVAVLAAAGAQVAKLRQPSRPSRAAIAAVTGSYAIYSALLWRRGARNDARGWALRGGVWAAGSALAAARAKVESRKAAADKAAVMIGGAATAVTSALAGDKKLRTRTSAGASHGANLLLASESLTYLRTLLEATPQAKAVAYAALGAQVLGQFLLVDALFHTPRR